MTKAADIRAKTADELGTMLLDLRKEQFNLRFQAATGQTEGVARVKPGRILFEIDGVTMQVAKEALALAAAKLPIKTRFIERISE